VDNRGGGTTWGEKETGRKTRKEDEKKSQGGGARRRSRGSGSKLRRGTFRGRVESKKWVHTAYRRKKGLGAGEFSSFSRKGRFERKGVEKKLVN